LQPSTAALIISYPNPDRSAGILASTIGSGNLVCKAEPRTKRFVVLGNTRAPQDPKVIRTVLVRAVTTSGEHPVSMSLLVEEVS
jgi:hypothetical protein